jgi:hypothetical protein
MKLDGEEKRMEKIEPAPQTRPVAAEARPEKQ